MFTYPVHKTNRTPFLNPLPMIELSVNPTKIRIFMVEKSDPSNPNSSTDVSNAIVVGTSIWKPKNLWHGMYSFPVPNTLWEAPNGAVMHDAWTTIGHDAGDGPYIL